MGCTGLVRRAAPLESASWCAGPRLFSRRGFSARRLAVSWTDRIGASLCRWSRQGLPSCSSPMVTNPGWSAPAWQPAWRCVIRSSTLSAITWRAWPRSCSRLRVQQPYAWATPGDVTALASLDAATFDIVWHLSAQELRSLLIQGSVQLACEGDTLVGYMAFTVNGEIAQLARLAVHPAWQGRGIGRQLFAHCLVNAAGQGCQRAVLNTQAANHDGAGALSSVWLHGNRAADGGVHHCNWLSTSVSD